MHMPDAINFVVVAETPFEKMPAVHSIQTGLRLGSALGVPSSLLMLQVWLLIVVNDCPLSLASGHKFVIWSQVHPK